MSLDKSQKLVLISITAYSSDGPRLLKQVVKDLREKSELLTLSSIYKVKGQNLNPAHIHDLRSVTMFEGLCVAAQLQTTLEPLEVLKLLKAIEAERKSELLHRNISLNILFYEDLTYMTPELTLPYPDLHLRPELAVPAAEIWGARLHPVLGRSLSELTKSFQKRDWGEFFAQGQSLLDF